MNKIIFTLAIAATAFVIGYLTGPGKATVGTVQAEQPGEDSLIKRGDYLVNAIGCDDCHSPKRMGPMGPEIIPELRFSGFQSNMPLPPIDTSVIGKGWAIFSPDLTFAAGPWGTSYASNISGDATGIGNWTEEQFFKAIREGKLKGADSSRMIMPPMPWQNFARLNDHDLKSIFRFLKSSQPVNNLVPLSQGRF